MSKRSRAGCFCCHPFEGSELKPLLKKFGLILEDNVAVEIDPLSRLMGEITSCPCGQVSGTRHHKNFGYATMFPLARSLAKISRPQRRHGKLPRLHQLPTLGETQYETEIKTEKNHQEPGRQGRSPGYPAAIEAGSGEKKSRIVVCGDPISPEQILHFPGQRQFFQQRRLLAGRGKRLIAIAPRSPLPNVSLTQSTAGWSFSTHWSYCPCCIRRRHRHLAVPEEAVSWKKIIAFCFC